MNWLLWNSEYLSPQGISDDKYTLSLVDIRSSTSHPVYHTYALPHSSPYRQELYDIPPVTTSPPIQPRCHKFPPRIGHPISSPDSARALLRDLASACEPISARHPHYTDIPHRMPVIARLRPGPCSCERQRTMKLLYEGLKNPAAYILRAAQPASCRFSTVCFYCLVLSSHDRADSVTRRKNGLSYQHTGRPAYWCGHSAVRLR